jgi:hypothetical protein
MTTSSSTSVKARAGGQRRIVLSRKTNPRITPE